MNTADQNYSYMAFSTFTKMNAYRSIWINNTAIKIEMDKLESNLSQLESVSKEPVISTINVTQDKVKAKAEAISAILKVTGPASVYALDIDNTTLHDKLNVSKGILNKMQDSVLPQRLIRLNNIISHIAHDLLEYGLTTEDISNANSKIKAYVSIVDDPKKLIAERSSKNKTLSVLIEELRDIFYRLDKLMRVYVDTDFYIEYRKSRKITDYPAKVENYQE